MSGAEGTADPFNGCSWYDDRGVLVMNVSQAERILAALTAEHDALREQVARVEALLPDALAEKYHSEPWMGHSTMAEDCFACRDIIDVIAALHPTDGAP